MSSQARVELLTASLELLLVLQARDRASLSPRVLLALLSVEAPAPQKVDDDDWVERPAEEAGAASKRLLLEILKRAAFDWVLFRGHRKLDKALDAETAHTWLFEEEPSHPDWECRQKEERVTSFLSVCAALDLDPVHVREQVRQLTPHRILNAGRPPETSRPYDHTYSVEVHVDMRTQLDWSGATIDDLLLRHKIHRGIAGIRVLMPLAPSCPENER